MGGFEHMKKLMESVSQLNEGRYWDNKGEYEKQAVELQKLVPNSGPSKTVRGEIFRAAMKIYYDYYNNGFGNIWPAPAQFLINHINFDNEVLEMFRDHAMGNLGNKIDNIVERMMSTVIEQIYEMDAEPNTGDMWDTKYNEDHYEPEQGDDEYDYDEDDEEEDF